MKRKRMNLRLFDPVHVYFRCVGSTQHLKNKYGGGYHLEIKLFPHHVDDESESGRNVQVSLSTSLNREAMSSPVKRQVSGGDGRLREVGLEHGSSALGALMDHVKKAFPGAVQVECFGDRATYSVPREAVSSLAQAFSELERSNALCSFDLYVSIMISPPPPPPPLPKQKLILALKNIVLARLH